MEDIMEKASKFFLGQNLHPPEKNLLSKLITRLFKISSKAIRIEGKRQTVYSDLYEKEENDQNKVIIPDHCTTTKEEESITVITHREYVIDNNNLKCSFKVYTGTSASKTITFILHGKEFPLLINLPFTQNTVDGLVHVCQEIQLCKGTVHVPDSVFHKNGVIEVWSNMFDQSSVKRIRSSSCDILLPLIGTSESCNNCKTFTRTSCTTKKRKATETSTENVQNKAKCTSQTSTSRSPLLAISNNNQNIDSSTQKEEQEQTFRSDDVIISDVNMIHDMIQDTASPVGNENIGKHEKSNTQSEIGNEIIKQPEQSNELSENNERQSKLNDIASLLPECAPEFLNILIQSQVQNCISEKHQRRWDPTILSVCLSIYCRSPRAYEDLRNSNILVLPSRSTLAEYKNSIKQQPGINTDNLTWMKNEATRQNVSDFGRRGGLIIDEMTIQDDLQVQRKGDGWDVMGYEDLGQTNNMIETITKDKKEVRLATSVLQLLFHGFSGFRWPVAFYATSSASTHQLYNIIWQCIDIMDEFGFSVNYLMLDGAAANRSLGNLLLGENPRASYIASNIFDQNQPICVIQDIKHVMKKIRNSIESSKSGHKNNTGRYIILEGLPVIWEHFEHAFHFNMQSGLRIHHRLTKEHILLNGASKMRNKLAIEVLDKNMLFLMKAYQDTLEDGSQLNSTVKLLTHTSELVEIFMDTRPIHSNSDLRLNSLKNIQEFFQQWEEDISRSIVYNPKKNLITRETRDDIKCSINGFLSLCQLHLGKGDSITPAYVNSDIIENHFCQQRGIRNGLNTNPTIMQYGPSNNAIILGQTTISRRSNAGTAKNYKYDALPPQKSKSNCTTSVKDK
ncbi:hypothetical protein FSP39_023224 [Pinctada imbricata]|uniref:Transposable element P transposase-like RNase H domain-containing protein n=1 Tax=Pinctada imbricata TaxID=66713 RepID=A0AA89CC64_PINIB|nr:hypothetical protein FSP39_023224 [Pinctada imbricata]